MTERELTRNATRRRKRGIQRPLLRATRASYYKWLRRYEELGVDGLRDRSRRPRVSPTATKAAVVDRIIYLRQNYHFGPLKIAMYLNRYHDISVSQSGVWRILRRLDLSRLPTSQRYKRHKERWKHYEKQRPGVSVQIDVKFIDPIRGVRKKHYQFTAIDDCTRLRVLKIYGQLNQKTAIQFADYVMERLPFQVQVIQTENGPEFDTMPLIGERHGEVQGPRAALVVGLEDACRAAAGQLPAE